MFCIVHLLNKIYLCNLRSNVLHVSLGLAMVFIHILWDIILMFCDWTSFELVMLFGFIDRKSKLRDFIQFLFLSFNYKLKTIKKQNSSFEKAIIKQLLNPKLKLDSLGNWTCSNKQKIRRELFKLSFFNCKRLGAYCLGISQTFYDN